MESFRRKDLDNWRPINLNEIKNIFKDANFKWAIAGGVALDLYLNKETRIHDDIDICILDYDLTRLFDYLKLQKLVCFKAYNGQLEIWNKEDEISDRYSIWVSEDFQTPFIFEVLILKTNEKEWVYKRNPKITKLIETIFIEKSDYRLLLPEIILLFKLGATQVRNKDYLDFYNTRPYLDEQALMWLEKYIHK